MKTATVQHVARHAAWALCLVLLSITATRAIAASHNVVSKRVVLSEFARCVARYAERSTTAYLQLPRGSAEEHKAAKTLAMGQSNCLTEFPSLSFNSDWIRGPLSEAMLARQPELLDRAAKFLPAPAPRAMASDMESFLISYADCLTRTDPAGSVAVIRTAVETPAEREAILAMGPALRDCMPLDLAYKLNIPDVRDHIAASLYLKAMEAGVSHAQA